MGKRKNRGFLERPELPADFIAGVASPIEYEVRLFTGNWEDHLPLDEWQRIGNVETMSCVSFSALNSVETQINWMLDNHINPDARIFLTNNGYLVDGKVNLSDRFLAIMSETTIQGNYLDKVAQTIRDYGFIPESLLPFEGTTWSEYMDKSKITQEMLDLGKESLKWFNIRYEFVVSPMITAGKTIEELNTIVMKHLRHAPLQLAKNGHATNYYLGVDNLYWGEYDTYSPFKKKKDWGYNPPFVLKILVTEKGEYSESQIMEAKKLVKKLIIDQHNRVYFFRPEANGEAYKILHDFSFKYKLGKKCPLFDELITDGTIIPISESDWDKIKPAEIK